MKIAIVGGGFTGLSAAFYLTLLKHEVVVFEKAKILGGLAATYKQSNWQYPVEQHYHHWFTNDTWVFKLIKEVGLQNALFFPKSQTSIFCENHIYPFNYPREVLNFSPLSPMDRVRAGLVSLYLKLLPPALSINLEKESAIRWLKKYYGEEVFRIVWEPLLTGKFKQYSAKVNMAWFWARIYKRTFKLGYLTGGYQALIDALRLKIIKNGGKVLLNSPFDPAKTNAFDKVIITTPSPVFIKMYPRLPKKYRQNLNSIPHLTALNLLLVTKEKFLKDTYWLNINDKSFPFVAVIQHTNLVDSKYYGNQHLTYIGNYLPSGHPYLKMTKEQLFKLYLPYLKKINHNFNFDLCLPRRQAGTLNFELFVSPFAQPVFPLNYSKIKPGFQTPIPNVYLSNMDMVYPWDRGTNYAVELGEKVARFVCREEEV